MLLKLLLIFKIAIGLTSRLPIGDAYIHAVSAVIAAGDDLDPVLLLAIAHVESGFSPYWVSRVDSVTGARKIGRYRGDSPVGTGKRFCGVLQAKAGLSWKRCLALRNPLLGYAAGADELRDWLRMSKRRFDRVHGHDPDWADRRDRAILTGALRGHGCGNAGLRGHPCRGYDRRVLRARAEVTP